jgi:hypothetical protein
MSDLEQILRDLNESEIRVGLDRLLDVGERCSIVTWSHSAAISLLRVVRPPNAQRGSRVVRRCTDAARNTMRFPRTDPAVMLVCGGEGELLREETGGRGRRRLFTIPRSPGHSRPTSCRASTPSRGAPGSRSLRRVKVGAVCGKAARTDLVQRG